ncbi:hypothetical protein C8J55DRAFT_527801 [Lentinula edodes]|uniref:Uncharacterized protein n=1 Tax=Lentinula lateritia TaxID=40482 RepID=A0A9W8ZTX7_9AGAR|nr:hypothetical protein C8J55DRAFT_527801 [Lentinula edodes]
MVLVEFQLPIAVSLLFSIFLLLPPVQRLCFPHPRLTPTHNPASSRFALLLHSLPSHSNPASPTVQKRYHERMSIRRRYARAWRRC